MQFTCTQCQTIDEHKLDQGLNEVVCLKCGSVIAISQFAKNALRGTNQVVPRYKEMTPKITANPIISEKDKATVEQKQAISNKLAAIAAQQKGANSTGATPAPRTFSPTSGPKTKAQMAADPTVVPGKAAKSANVGSTTAAKQNTSAGIKPALKPEKSAQGLAKQKQSEARLAALRQNADTLAQSATIQPARVEPPPPVVGFDIEDIAAQVLSGDDLVVIDSDEE